MEYIIKIGRNSMIQGEKKIRSETYDQLLDNERELT